MHVSVLLNESIENLNIKEDGIYVDCTLGFAGHSKEILKRIKKGNIKITHTLQILCVGSVQKHMEIVHGQAHLNRYKVGMRKGKIFALR